MNPSVDAMKPRVGSSRVSLPLSGTTANALWYATARAVDFPGSLPVRHWPTGQVITLCPLGASQLAGGGADPSRLRATGGVPFACLLQTALGDFPSLPLTLLMRTDSVG